MVADARLTPRLAEIDTAMLRQVVMIGDGPGPIEGLELLPEAALTEAGEEFQRRRHCRYIPGTRRRRS